MRPNRTLLSIVFACLFALPQSFSQSTSTQGKEFWLSFMHNGFKDHTAGGWVVNQVLISAKRDCTGTVSNPLTGWSQSFSLSANGITTVEIPEEQGYHNGTQYERIFEKGIKVTASDTVSVYCTNIAHVSFDASFVLPVESLGDEYIVQCCDQSRPGHNPYVWNNETTAFVIVATEDNTDIDITPTVKTLGGHSAHQTFTVTMHAGETYHVRSDRITSSPIDLSGTRIFAHDCKRIAVFNGNTVTCVPADAGNGYDHVFEQAMPLRSWGRNFVVTGSKSRRRDFVKVTSSADGNILTMNGATLDTLAAGKSYYFPLLESEGSCYLQTSQPSAVYLYNSSHDATQGDPSMVWIAPVEQRIKDVTFSTFDHPDINIQTHCVNIIVKTDDVEDVYLDGELIPASEFLRVNGNNAYSYARMDIGHGVHRISCDNGFNAHVYGFGSAKGYAYLAGSNATNLSATLSVNGETVLPHEEYPFCADREMTFHADVNLSQYDLLWDFGDGSTSTENPATHTYREQRVYDASLHVVTDEGGCWSSASDTIRFRVDATQHYSIQSEEVCEGEAYTGHGFEGVTIHNDTVLACMEANAVHAECMDSVLVYITAKRNVTHRFDTVACNAFVWDGIPYDQPGTVTHDYPASNGCDSIVHLDLSLTYSPGPDRIRCTTPDAVVFGPYLDTVAVVTNTEFFSFQYTFRVGETEHPECEWDRCVWTISQPSWAIEFDTMPELTPEGYASECKVYVSEPHKDYAILTATMDNGCGSETRRYYLKSSFLDVEERNTVAVTLHPNPAKESVTIENAKVAEVKFYNTLGQLVKTARDTNDINVSDMQEGLYVLRILDAEGFSFTKRIIVAR